MGEGEKGEGKIKGLQPSLISNNSAHLIAIHSQKVRKPKAGLVDDYYRACKSALLEINTVLWGRLSTYLSKQIERN
jgi:hypothetical protein